MQGDGNLVAYSNGTPYSSSQTNNMKGSSSPYTLIMQNDGNLVIYNQANKPIWATGTVVYSVHEAIVFRLLLRELLVI